MACPGGCLGGGGQPIPTSPEIRRQRTSAIYSEDAHKMIRKSHENPEVLRFIRIFSLSHSDTCRINCCTQLIRPVNAIKRAKGAC
ncbi:iron hydrogenase small subunit [Geofilum rubicundum]